MEIKGKVHCFFEQSGTFKNELISDKWRNFATKSANDFINGDIDKYVAQYPKNERNSSRNLRV